MAVITNDTFDPLRQYVSVRLQQGVPIVDADWNEAEDIRRFELRAFLKWCIGDGIPTGNNGFALIGMADDVTISAGIAGAPEGLGNVGRALVNGLDVVISADVKYSAQKLHVSQDPSGKLATAWNVPPIPALPVGANLTAYLDVWDRLVTPTEDPSLVQPGLQVESCARLKREWCVRVTAGAPPAVQVGHSYLPLATLSHPAAGQPVQITSDLRRRGVSLQALFDGSALLSIRQLAVGGAVTLAGGNWDVTNTEGDLKIGNSAMRLKMGVALGGGGAGDARIRVQGGTNRLMVGGGNNDTMAVTPTGVGIGTLAPNAPLSFGNGVANTKIALWDNGNPNAMYGLGIQGAQFRLHTDNANARFTFLDAPAGNELVNLYGNGGSPGNALMDVGFPNPIRFSSVHTGFSNNVTNQAEITSDTNTYKTLMLVGNKAGGIKDNGGNVLRRVSVWDRLEVAVGSLSNSITAGFTPKWVTDQNSEVFKFPYECVSVNDQGHNLRLVSPNGVFVHAPQGLMVNSGGLLVNNGGLTVNSGGLTVRNGGLSVTNGSLTVTGGILTVAGGAAAKNFRIPHPLDPENRDLVHSCLEGPEIAVFYRGEGKLVNGTARVELPPYFEALTRKEGRTVQLTAIFEGPETPVSQLAASRVANGLFSVHAVDGKNASQPFYWEVKAARADAAPLEVETMREK